MPSQKSVLLVDDDESLLEALQLIVENLTKYTALTAKSMREVQSLGPKALTCDLALLDINLGHDQPSGINIYHWLRSNGFSKPIAYLTGHARTHPLVEQALRSGDVKVFSKPLEVNEIVKILQNEFL